MCVGSYIIGQCYVPLAVKAYSCDSNDSDLLDPNRLFLSPFWPSAVQNNDYWHSLGTWY